MEKILPRLDVDDDPCFIELTRKVQDRNQSYVANNVNWQSENNPVP